MELFENSDSELLTEPIMSIDRPGLQLCALDCQARADAGSVADNQVVTMVLELAQEVPGEVSLSFRLAADFLSSAPEFVSRAVQRHSVAPARLIVEVGQLPSEAPLGLLGALDELRSAGVRVALGELAFCGASLAVLLGALPDYYKLGGRLVSGCGQDQQQQAVLEAVAGVAWRLGAAVIAEGVEDAADLEMLRNHGVSLAQGRLFSHPVPWRELKERMADHGGRSRGRIQIAKPWMPRTMAVCPAERDHD